MDHALPRHEGKYKCNSLHPNYHKLHVKRSHKHNNTIAGSLHRDNNKINIIQRSDIDSLSTNQMELDDPEFLFRTTPINHQLHHHHQQLQLDELNRKHHHNKEILSSIDAAVDPKRLEFPPTEVYQRSDPIGQLTGESIKVNEDDINERIIEIDGQEIYSNASLQFETLNRDTLKVPTIDDQFNRDDISVEYKDVTIPAAIANVTTELRHHHHHNHHLHDFDVDECLQCDIDGAVAADVTTSGVSKKFEKLSNDDIRSPIMILTTKGTIRMVIPSSTSALSIEIVSTTTETARTSSDSVLFPQNISQANILPPLDPSSITAASPSLAANSVSSSTSAIKGEITFLSV